MSVSLVKASLDYERIADDYMECLVWSSIVMIAEDAEPVEADQFELSAEAVDTCAVDVRAFVDSNARDCAAWEAAGFSVGHDFALTRNGHGTGFWDRDYSGGTLTRVGERLTKASEAYGSVDLYVNDDGELDVM